MEAAVEAEAEVEVEAEAAGSQVTRPMTRSSSQNHPTRPMPKLCKAGAAAGAVYVAWRVIDSCRHFIRHSGGPPPLTLLPRE